MTVDRCLSVVMPCYNEEATVEEILARVLDSPYTAEVVVVDDGSRDGTVELVEAVMARDPRVRLVRQPFNMGKGAALQRGFLEVTQTFVVVQDADLEYDPRDYEALMGPLIDGRADVVFGSRFLTGGPHRVLYFWHSVGNKLLTLASNVMTNLNLTDMETCYKAFRREVLDHVSLEEARFGIEPELTAKVAAGQWRVWEVGISYAGRTYEEGKKIGLKDAFRAGYCVLRYSWPGERLARSSARRTGPDVVAATRAPAPGGADVVEALGVGALCTGVVGGLESAAGADTVVAVDALACAEDDRAALAAIGEHLVQGTRLVLIEPAHEVLYGEADRELGRHRRYGLVALVNLLGAAGFDVIGTRSVDGRAAAGWLIRSRLLGGRVGRSSGRSTADEVLELGPWVAVAADRL